MRLAAGVLVLLTIPGLVFGFLARVPEPQSGAIDPGHIVHEPWLDALTGLALAAAIIVAVAFVHGVLYFLRSDRDPGGWAMVGVSNRPPARRARPG